MTNRTGAVTRKDVAERAGVSETIVSYVINNNRYVSGDKRERVLKAVRELNYRPNSIARALKGKGTSHILFVVDNVANDYFGRLIQEIDAIAYDKGFIVSLTEAKNNKEFISRILMRQVDAVIISSTLLSENYVQELIDRGMPVVLLMTRDYASVCGQVARIYTGIESGIMAGVRHLYEGGCRALVHVDRVSVNGHFSTRQDLRYRGFCNQMEALGLPLSSDSFISGCRDYEELYQKVFKRILEGPDVDGFICRNDRLACTVLQAVLATGKKVPEDVCVIGFDNSDIGKFIRPALSSVAHDQKGIAQAAMEMIGTMISGNPSGEAHLLSQLVLRDTTRE